MALFKTLKNYFKRTPGDAGGISAHQQRLLQRMRDIPKQDAPKGWEISVQKSVGGLRYIGFSEVQAGKLLVISTAGKSIIDGYSGQVLFRDPNDENYDGFKLISEGVADLKGETIRLAGVTGGGLPTINAECGFIRRCAPDYPEELFIFEPSGRSIFFDDLRQFGCCTIYEPIGETAAYGFSPCGNLLVIADTATLMVWKKKCPPRL